MSGEGLIREVRAVWLMAVQREKEFWFFLFPREQEREEETAVGGGGCL